ncbi:peptide/nickel transport system substrate-binding protein [Kineosphaera limosa]|uniref:Putative ABC transporter substrate-binding protein n=1 Tax=Kineosphaera limosa NBRC 100340 TaxID=1184609 RepID=K6WXE6_9MICO|nr:ABC transporter family substrate-binding protein [Kineosphaera limosa]NYE01854.1 peptide/nickel transport system substrate-binding protein [Kineosphaera limosa]GAB96757.1 putative ABC transporter substrate-binding protein [Kineosphaera limosa NBRC 100340]
MPGTTTRGTRATTLRTASLALTCTLAAACSLPGPGADPASTGATGPDGPHAASALAALNAHPREQLKTGGNLTLPLDTFPEQWNVLNIAGADADLATVTSATDPVLYDYSPEGEVTPRADFLAAMPTQAQRDGREVITYDLNPQARWNDGTPIDHRSFESAWRASRSDSGYATASAAGYDDIESVTAGSRPHQVVVTFKEGRAFHPFTDLFAGGLLHPEAAKSPETFNTGFGGTEFHPEWRAGPFTLEQLNPTTKVITFKRNPNWWGAPALLDRVTFQAMEDSATIPAFANGEIDATRVTTRARYEQVAATGRADIRRSQRLTTGVLVFNSHDPALADIRVRRALWQAIDREQWKRVRYEGMEWQERPVGSAMYFSFQPQARDNVPVTFDRDAARATLQDAGYTLGADNLFAKDGQRLSIGYTSFGDDPMTTALDQTLKTQLAAVGVELNVRNVSYQAFQSAMEHKDFGMALLGMGPTTPSPVGSACQLMCSDSPFNISGVGTPELDQRVRTLTDIADPNAQADQINDVEKEWLALFGQLPMANGPDVWAYHPGLANLGPAAFASIHPHWENVGWVAGS